MKHKLKTFLAILIMGTFLLIFQFLSAQVEKGNNGGSDNFLSLLSAVNLLNVLFVTYILSFRGDWGTTLCYLVFSSFILMSGMLLLFKGDFSSLVIRISEAFKSASQSGNIL